MSEQGSSVKALADWQDFNNIDPFGIVLDFCGTELFYHSQKLPTMLYLIAVILIIGWALGFFYFSVGGVIHILLVIAVIAILLRLIRGDRVV